MNKERFIEILQAEYAYWKGCPPSDADEIAMGAMAATANVLAAVYGHPAPWHPKDPQSPSTDQKQP